MDIIPLFKAIGALLLFGMTYYFLNLLVNPLVDGTGVTNSIYLQAGLFIFSAAPIIVLFGVSLRGIKESQKRRIL